MMRYYETNVPGLLHKLKENYWHKSMGTQQKVVVIRTLMNRCDVDHWKTWGRANRIRLGGWLLDCICESSNWFMTDMRNEGSKRQTYVVPTPEFIAIKDQFMALLSCLVLSHGRCSLNQMIGLMRLKVVTF